MQTILKARTGPDGCLPPEAEVSIITLQNQSRPAADNVSSDRMRLSCRPTTADAPSRSRVFCQAIRAQTVTRGRTRRPHRRQRRMRPNVLLATLPTRFKTSRTMCRICSERQQVSLPRSNSHRRSRGPQVHQHRLRDHNRGNIAQRRTKGTRRGGYRHHMLSSSSSSTGPPLGSLLALKLHVRLPHRPPALQGLQPSLQQLNPHHALHPLQSPPSTPSSPCPQVTSPL